MLVKDVMCRHFATLGMTHTNGQALAALHKLRAEYGLVADGASVRGYVTTADVGKAGQGDPAGTCLRSFAGEVCMETELLDAGSLSGEALLVYDRPGRYVGILDIPILYRRLDEIKKELDAIINFSSDEIYITDSNGITLRVNKVFEENSGVPVEEVLGRSVFELEQSGIFEPSVTRLVLEQRKQLTVQQVYKNQRKVLVTGTPVFNGDNSIFRVIINTRDTDKLNQLKADLEQIEDLKNRYYQELVALHSVEAGAENIVANSTAMTDILCLARKMAGVDAIVMLLGETGVGKGLIARYIHDNSPRKDRAFITINCGAIPETLLESELFGYEPGAFSGAHVKGKIGKIDLADKGTLFLDEIGDLPYSLQVKLLQVIQEKVITRIGGTKEKQVDVRFIVATNRDLNKMVSEGIFRKDLYYRLNVVPLEIPPLRQREKDIIPLIERFLEKYNKKCRKNKSISPVTLEYLNKYYWPGNVRELENLIERLVIVINEDIIEIHHLPDSIKMANITYKTRYKEYLHSEKPLDKLMEEMEKNILQELYQQMKNTYKIAHVLKVNQSTVVRKLHKYGICQDK